MGIYPGWKQDKVAGLQAAWDTLELSDLKTKGDLSEISRKATSGFQVPRTDYDVWDWLNDLYEVLVDLQKEERATLLHELSIFYRKRRGATKYGGLVRAGCARWYDNPKRISWAARLLRDAVQAKVSLEKFADFCETYGKS